MCARACMCAPACVHTSSEAGPDDENDEWFILQDLNTCFVKEQLAWQHTKKPHYMNGLLEE